MKYFKTTFLKKLAFSGLVFILLLVLAEIVLSAIGLFPNDYYTQTPNAKHTYDKNPSNVKGVSGFYEMTFDALGSRSASDYTKATHKIIALGGSTTICSVLTQEKTWTALLDKKLGDDYWVGNFGRPGNSSNHHILQFKHILDKPELKDTETVLILVGVNDCRGYLISQEKYMHMPEIHIKKSAFEHIPNTELSFLKSLTLYKLAKQARIRIGYYFLEERPVNYLETFESDAKPITTLPDVTKGLQHYERNLIAIIEEAKKRDISLVFMTQPTIWQKNLPKNIKTLLAARSYYHKTPLYTGEALDEIMTMFNKRLLAVCNRYNVPVIDLQLPKNDTIFYDDMHFNETGAEVVAEKVYQFLKTNP